MKLPAVHHPERYAGLYVYDFGTHVAVGYTAAEIFILRQSKAHQNGTAYHIYRVTAEGGFELRGVLDERLTAREAICFLRTRESAAKRDYDDLHAAAQDSPLPCAVELHLAHVDEFDPPHLTAVCYAASATTAVADWLGRNAPAVGDRVVGGIDAYSALAGRLDGQVTSCTLPSLLDYIDRPTDEVLRTVDRAIQR